MIGGLVVDRRCEPLIDSVNLAAVANIKLCGREELPVALSSFSLIQVFCCFIIWFINIINIIFLSFCYCSVF
jgi:hypothetical protein